MLRLDHIAIAGYHIKTLVVGDAQQGLEPPQAAIRSPVLRQFERRTGEIAEFLELALKTLEQRKGVRGAAGKARQHLAAVQATHLSGIALHHALSERHLAVAADRNATMAPNGQNRGAVNPLWIVIHVKPQLWGRGALFQAALTPRTRMRGVI